MLTEYTATSWNDLQEFLFDIPFNPTLNRFRSGNVFRGLNSTAYRRMETSLMRLGGAYWDKERHLIRNFRKYAYQNVDVGDSDWHWLPVGQHYGVPTRLLDWTYSPYIALHFATSDLERMDKDGLIWRVDIDRTNQFLPQRLHGILNEEGAYVFTPELLEKAAADLASFDRIEGEFALFLEPPSLDGRIVNQFALFSLMSSPRLRFNDWLDRFAVPYDKIIIPKELKWEVRDKLDQANITERVVYPGLEGLAAWLKRHYYTR
jgi:hypothetical protein